MTHAEARAHAKGATAQAKALRPWWKKKRSWIGIILGFIIVISIINGLSGNKTDPSSTVGAPATQAPADEVTTTPPGKAPSNKTPATKAPEPKAAGIGTKVAAGDWDFTVTKFKCGAKKVGNQYLNKKAQGQFCVLNLSVKNNGDKAETLTGDNQKLLDNKGREFSSDYEASTYADPDSSIFLENINPGNTKKGLVVFDVPKDAKPVQAQLAGGLFGIKDVASVDLTK